MSSAFGSLIRRFASALGKMIDGCSHPVRIEVERRRVGTAEVPMVEVIAQCQSCGAVVSDSLRILAWMRPSERAFWDGDPLDQDGDEATRETRVVIR